MNSARQRASHWAGRFAQHPVSRRLIPWFVRHYGVDLAEAYVPPAGFPTLQAFFTRRLKPGARPLAVVPHALTSPCDGTVGASGEIAGDTLLQAKGHAYSLAALLAGPDHAATFHGGLYATIYLAPADYHRVHAPANARLTAARYISGTYFSVNPRAVATVDRLFTRNERMILSFDTSRGPLALVLVGACLVGGIRLVSQPPLAVSCGDEVAWFEFGSTVILLAAPAVAHSLAVTTNQRIRMGDALAVGS